MTAAEPLPPPRGPIPVHPERPLRLPPLSPSQRTLVAVVHLGSVLPIWGLAVGFWVWHTRREEHPEMRFQALQAIVWQGLGLLVTVAYAVAHLFFQLLVVLSPDLASLLLLANTWLWWGLLGLLALSAVAGAFAVRLRGTYSHPLVGHALRRELAALDEDERTRGRR